MLKKILLGMIITLSTLSAIANNSLNEILSNSRNQIPGLAQPTILPAEEAFKLTPSLDTRTSTLQLHWHIAPDTYLYQDKLKVTTSVPLSYEFPAGEKITDEFFGEQTVYFHDLLLTIQLPDNLPATFPLTINYQGCATAGFCYPPITETWQVDKQSGIITRSSTPHANATEEIAEITTLQHANAFTLTALLADSQFGWILLIFYAMGLLLTFTPCVLPMIPILSSIIIGQNMPTRSTRAFLLSLSYVAGMALTYTLAGVFAGLAGQTLQSYLQTPLFIGISAVFLVLLALNLFGYYRLQLPTHWERSVTAAQQRISGGRYISAALLGLLSALVVSPCVTAPLIGALTYISTTGDALLGGSALLALALGMGTPLLLIGTFGPQLLPRAGSWLISVQHIFGVLLIAIAIWLISRLLSETVTLVLWGMFAIILASYLGAWQLIQENGWPRLQQGIAWIVLICGALLFIRGAQPMLNTWFPHSAFSVTSVSTAKAPAFTTVKNWAEVEQKIQQSTKPVLLDFYAEWCVTCKIIEQRVFPAPEVAALLQQFTLLRADVTAQNSLDRELQKHLQVFAPPALLFFAPGGNEIANTRIVGDVTPEVFSQHLQHILNTK